MKSKMLAFLLVLCATSTMAADTVSKNSGWAMVDQSGTSTVEVGLKKRLSLNGSSLFWMKTKTNNPFGMQLWDTSLTRVYADCVSYEYHIIQSVQYLDGRETKRDDNPSIKTIALVNTPVYLAISMACQSMLEVNPIDIFAGAIDG